MYAACDRLGHVIRVVLLVQNIVYSQLLVSSLFQTGVVGVNYCQPQTPIFFNSLEHMVYYTNCCTTFFFHAFPTAIYLVFDWLMFSPIFLFATFNSRHSSYIGLQYLATISMSSDLRRLVFPQFYKIPSSCSTGLYHKTFSIAHQLQCELIVSASS